MNYPIYPEIVNHDNNLPASLDAKDLQDEIVIELFLKTKSVSSPKTAIMYESVLQDFLKFVDKPIRYITHPDILDYINYLSTPQPGRKALKVTTQNMKLSVVKSFYKYLIQLGYIKLNPAEPIPVKKQQQQIANKLIPVEDMKRIFEVVEKRRKVEQVILYFLASTGCRVSEFCGARMNHFFVTPQGHIGIIVEGKGGKTRVRKIRPKLWEQICEYRKEEGLPCAIDPTDNSPVVITPAGNPYTPGAVWKIIKNVVKEAGLNEKITTHWFRHTFATHAAASGVDVWKLREEMGHSTIATTEIYVHIAQDMERTSVDEIKYINEIEEIIAKSNL